MSGFNLGNAHGTVTIDSSGINSAVNNAQSQFSSMTSMIGGNMQQLGGQISGVGTQITKMTLPLVGLGTVGLRTAMRFDTAMNAISARTGLTGDALKEVETLAMDMGAATVFSSQEAADAMLQLLTAGLSVEEAMATLPNVLNAAAASGEDLALMAEFTTNIMNSFGLTAADTADIVDNMSRAASASPASMAEMGVALQRIGGLAKGMGMDVNEASALLAILANNGIRGEEAGTQVKSMLVAMQRDTPGVAAAWDRLGTSLYDVNGNARDLNDVFEDIRIAMADMTAEEKNQIITELAGTYGMTAFNALLGADAMMSFSDALTLVEQGSLSATDVFMGLVKGIGELPVDQQNAELEKLYTAFNKIAGETEWAGFDSLVASLEGIAPTAENLDVILGNIDDTFSNLSPDEQAEVWGSLSAAFEESGIKAEVAIGAIANMQASMTGQSSAAAVAAARMDTFEGVISSLQGSIETLMISTLRPFMNDVLKPLGEQAIELVNSFNAWATANPVLTANIMGLLGLLVMIGPSLFMFGKLIAIIGSSISALGAIVGFVLSPIGILVAAVAAVVYVFRDALKPLSGIIDMLDGFWMRIQNVAEVNGFGEAVAYAFRHILDVVKQILPIIGAVLSDIGGQLWAGLQQGLSALVGLAGWIWENTIKPMLNDLANWFTSGQALYDLSVFGTWLLERIQEGLDALAVIGSYLWDNVVGPMVDDLINWFASGQALKDLSGFGTWLLGGLLKGIVVIGSWLWDNVVGPLVDNLINYIISGQAIKDLVSFGTWFLRILLTGIGVIAGWLWNNVISPMVDDLINWLLSGQAIKDLVSFGTWLLGTLLTGIGVIAGWLWDNLISPMIDDLINWFTSGQALKDLSSFGEWILGLLADAIGDMAGWAYDKIVKPILDAILQASTAMSGMMTGADGWALGGAMPVSADERNQQAMIQPVTSNAAGTPWTGGMGINTVAGIVHGQEAVVPHGGMRVFPSPNGLQLEGFGDLLAAMARSMSSPGLMPAAGMAGGAGGGGNNYYLSVEVPVEVLRNEPQLATNAERFGEAIMNNLRGRS